MTIGGEGFATHDVLNQPGDLAGYNAFADDRPLVAACDVFGLGWARQRFDQTGWLVGSAETQRLARVANRQVPELVTHDRFGYRVDRVEFHPAYHELMRLVFAGEAHCLAWTEQRPGAHTARAVLSYLWNQAENGVCCPMGMTFAAPAALRHDPAMANQWEPLILRAGYDPRPVPAHDKAAITVGMAMTEKQGGSDLRQTQTTAKPMGASHDSGSEYLITGHKWFFSVPMSDIFLTLARTRSGVSCFLVPGWLPDGTRNRLQIQRLKDKCGNRSNASSEVEFRDLYAVLLGEEGRGIRTIIEMAHLTRLDFAVGSAGLVRQAVSQALHHVSNRRAFQRALIDLPVMTNVIADLSLEAEALMWMGLRLADALDRSAENEAERLISRIATPMAKYVACKRAPMVVAEALECHGGNGFIEDHLLARLYREAPLNGIWEGTGNVICLDVLRAIEREPSTVDAFLDELALAKGVDRAFDRHFEQLAEDLPNLPKMEVSARRTVEMMAFGLQASLLLRFAPAEVSGAFCASRLAGDWGAAYGTLPKGVDAGAIARRAALASGG